MKDNPFDFRRDTITRTYTGDFDIELRAQHQAEERRRREESERRSEQRWATSGEPYLPETYASDTDSDGGFFGVLWFIFGLPTVAYFVTEHHYNESIAWVACLAMICLLAFAWRTARITYLLVIGLVCAVAAWEYVEDVGDLFTQRTQTHIQDDRVVVGKGDSLSRIAQAVTGEAGRWRELHVHNLNIVGPDPRQLKEGQIIYLPPSW